MKIYVTGKHGYIGSALIPILESKGYEIVPFIEGAETIIYLKAIASNTLGEIDKKETWEVNYFNVIEAAKYAKQLGIKRFIFPSGMSIFTNPESTYSLTKYHTECKLMSLADDNFKVIILRPGVVYGESPNMRYDTVVNNFALAKKYNSGIKIKNPDAIVPIVEIHHLCNMFIKALSMDTNIINVVDEELEVEKIAKRYGF